MLIKLNNIIENNNNLSIPHKGVVVDNDDSEKKLGRVKCTIAGLIEEADPIKLPWIFPKNPSGLGGKVDDATPDGSKDSSSFIVPEVGSELLIEFPFNDVYTPVYDGYWQSSLTHQILFGDPDLVDDYPNVYGWVDSTGNHMRVNKTSGLFDMLHSSGTTFSVDTNGNITITNPGTLDWTAQNKITIQSTTGDIDLKTPGGSINLNP